jgi:hypothetical protein
MDTDEPNGRPEDLVSRMMVELGDPARTVQCEQEGATSYYCVAELESGATWEGCVSNGSFTSDD